MSDKNDSMRIAYTRAATRHRVAKESIRHVISHCGVPFEEDPPETGSEVRDVRLVYIGDDAAGVALEVIAVEVSDGELLVIHAMRLRSKYKQRYEEAKRWRL